MRDHEKQRTYDAETVAFQGTPLGDRLSEDDVIAEYREVRDSVRWPARRFDIVKSRVDMTRAGGMAVGATQVKTSAGRTQRYTVSHECAHLLHSWEGRGAEQAAHGSTFRRYHLRTVALIYGEAYAALLDEAYRAFGLEQEVPALDADPIINIDALSIATAPTGGWNRSMS